MDDFQFILNNLDKIGMGGGVISTGAYFVWQKIKSDNKIDTIESKSQGLIDNLTKQLETERKENMELRDAIERVAVERNDAVKDLGELQGEVKSLETQVTLLTVQVSKLEEENRRLTLEVRLMHQQMMECFSAMKINPLPIAPVPQFIPQFIGDNP